MFVAHLKDSQYIRYFLIHQENIFFTPALPFVEICEEDEGKSNEQSHAGLKLMLGYIAYKKLKTGKRKAGSNSLYPVSEAAEGFSYLAHFTLVSRPCHSRRS
jgi:hypothetical protein